MAYRKYNDNGDGRSAEDRALDRFADLMVEKIKSPVRLAETLVYRGQPEMAQEPEREGV